MATMETPHQFHVHSLNEKLFCVDTSEKTIWWIPLFLFVISREHSALLEKSNPRLQINCKQ